MKAFLRGDVVVDPTICGWYAWLQMLPPHAAALNLVNRYLPILHSFVSHPDLHYKVLHEQRLIGGPYVDMSVNDVTKIQEFIDGLCNNVSFLTDLAEEIEALEARLSCTQGETLSPLYEELPESLRGLVELVYNERNSPSVRFLEPLLYKKFSNKLASSQAVFLSKAINLSDRAFVLSTPRLHLANSLKLSKPFFESVYDELFAARQNRVDVSNLATKLEIYSENERDIFQSFFTEVAPESQLRKRHDLTVSYYGHATILLSFNGFNILIDPLISYSDDDYPAKLTFSDLPEHIDLLLISHGHYDHFNVEALLQIRHKVKKVVVPSNNQGSILDVSLKLALEYIGFSDVLSLDVCEVFSDKDYKVSALPFWGEHADYDIRSKTVYMVCIGSKRLVFATDMNYIARSGYQQLIDDAGIDALFIGTECVGAPSNWLYGPLITGVVLDHDNKHRRLASSDAMRAHRFAKDIKAKKVFVYALGQEPWLSYVMGAKHSADARQIREADKLVTLLNQDGVPAKRLYLKDQFCL